MEMLQNNYLPINNFSWFSKKKPPFFVEAGVTQIFRKEIGTHSGYQ